MDPIRATMEEEARLVARIAYNLLGESKAPFADILDPIVAKHCAASIEGFKKRVKKEMSKIKEAFVQDMRETREAIEVELKGAVKAAAEKRCIEHPEGAEGAIRDQQTANMETLIRQGITIESVLSKLVQLSKDPDARIQLEATKTIGQYLQMFIQKVEVKDLTPLAIMAPDEFSKKIAAMRDQLRAKAN